jgi:hypothetical protein
MARKISKVIIHGKHIEVETDCPDCPESNKSQKVVKPNNQTDKEIEDNLKQKYPWANISKK